MSELFREGEWGERGAHWESYGPAAAETFNVQRSTTSTSKCERDFDGGFICHVFAKPLTTARPPRRQECRRSRST
jgi:hypothetical protein